MTGRCQHFLESCKTITVKGEFVRGSYGIQKKENVFECIVNRTGQQLHLKKEEKGEKKIKEVKSCRCNELRGF